MKGWPDLQVDVNFSDRIADIVEDGFDLAVRIRTCLFKRAPLTCQTSGLVMNVRHSCHLLYEA
ncbi:hypothetical protein RU07_23935 [Agrobacterium tumefaciens]|uniref:LysR family transcriptional regulator n=1 Tax=Agrobacterium tumefaciens TaxID=358 RepID=A0A0D0JQL3_AGRTU|nr:hypothetical protein RU07_23935 [Agrobacterium tumefaciens]